MQVDVDVNMILKNAEISDSQLKALLRGNEVGDICKEVGVKWTI